MSKWVGESVRVVRACFSLAAKLAPCVLFLDEVSLRSLISHLSLQAAVYHQLSPLYLMRTTGKLLMLSFLPWPLHPLSLSWAH